VEYKILKLAWVLSVLLGTRHKFNSGDSRDTRLRCARFRVSAVLFQYSIRGLICNLLAACAGPSPSLLGSVMQMISRSQWLRGLRPLGCWGRVFESRSSMDVCLLCLYVVLSCVGRGLCDELITHPEESYRVSVCVWSRNPEKGGQRSILDYKRLWMNEWMNDADHKHRVRDLWRQFNIKMAIVIRFLLYAVIIRNAYLVCNESPV
jgi:hypothetical protein